MKSFGLVGRKLGHSFSKRYFDEQFKGEFDYSFFELENISDLVQLISERKDLCGLNVTIPFKQSVIPFLDCVSPLAKDLEAVNVINIGRSSQLVGDNTDAPAFEQSLKGYNLTNKRALVLGTGGAAKSVCYVFNRNEIPFLSVSRYKSGKEIGYEEVTPELLREYEIVVNTTPLGTYPDISFCPNIPYGSLSSNHLLYDLTYNPSETLFMKKGKQNGCLVKNGLEMLLLQAQLSWKIWGI